MTFERLCADHSDPCACSNTSAGWLQQPWDRESQWWCEDMTWHWLVLWYILFDPLWSFCKLCSACSVRRTSANLCWSSSFTLRPTVLLPQLVGASPGQICFLSHFGAMTWGQSAYYSMSMDFCTGTTLQDRLGDRKMWSDALRFWIDVTDGTLLYFCVILGLKPCNFQKICWHFSGDKFENMILLVAVGASKSMPTEWTSLCCMDSLCMLQGAAQMRTRVGDDIAVMRKGSIFGEAILSACYHRNFQTKTCETCRFFF